MTGPLPWKLCLRKMVVIGIMVSKSQSNKEVLSEGQVPDNNTSGRGSQSWI